MASEGLHEDAGALRPETIDRHRAWISVREEIEALDWYDQRIDATQDQELRAILTHNRDEEKEHAVMLLAWLATRDPIVAAELTEKLRLGGADEGDGERASGRPDGSLGIGSLRGRAV
jgi:hypothetical protein